MGPRACDACEEYLVPEASRLSRKDEVDIFGNECVTEEGFDGSSTTSRRSRKALAHLMLAPNLGTGPPSACTHEVSPPCPQNRLCIASLASGRCG